MLQIETATRQEMIQAIDEDSSLFEWFLDRELDWVKPETKTEDIRKAITDWIEADPDTVVF